MATVSDYDSLRKDVGATIVSMPDPECEAIFDQAQVLFTDASTITAYTRVIALRQLAAQAATLIDYTQNNSKEGLGKVFENYMRLLQMWSRLLTDAIELTSAGNVRFGQTRRKPARVEEYPDYLGMEPPWWQPMGYGDLLR